MHIHKEIHRDFRLNDNHYTVEDMMQVACNYIKDGKDFQKPLGRFILDWFDNHPNITLQTSGTTGIPKQITVPKQAMIDSALATGRFFNLEPKDKALCCLPVNFIAGKMMLVRAIVLGLDLHFIEPTAFPLTNKHTKYDFVAMSPMQVENSIRQLDLVKKLIIGGSKVSKSLQEKLLPLATLSYETYASTETLTHIAARKIGEEYFKLLPGIKIELDPRGCLMIEAPRISMHKIITNDLVEITPENQFRWIGRVDNVVNSGGIKLSPESIEAKLTDKIPYRFFIAGVPDEVLGEKLILIVEAEEFTLAGNVFESLDKYEKPKEVVFMPKFLETESGKIKRKKIIKTILKNNIG